MRPRNSLAGMVNVEVETGTQLVLAAKVTSCVQQFPEQGLLATRGGAVGEELGEYRYVWPTEVPRNTG